MPDWAAQLLQTYGPGTFVSIVVALAVLFLSKAFSGILNAASYKDTTMTGLTVRLDDERRQWQERYDSERQQWEVRHNNLQAEFTNFRIEQAKKEGGLDVLQQSLTQERTERREFERAIHLENHNLKVRVEELEKYKQQGLDRIRELETEREGLMQKVTERDARITVLEAQVIEQTNRADTLNELVKRHQEAAAATPLNNTQPIPDVDDTFIPEIEKPAAVAEEEKPQ